MACTPMSLSPFFVAEELLPKVNIKSYVLDITSMIEMFLTKRFVISTPASWLNLINK